MNPVRFGWIMGTVNGVIIGLSLGYFIGFGK